MIKHILKKYSSTTDIVKYIQVGAHDGISNDFIYPYLKKYSWKGIRIEPVPYLYEKLKKLHIGDSNTICLNMAISDNKGKKIFFTVDKLPEDPIWTDQLASFNLDVILKHADKINNLKSKIRDIYVECISINQIIEKYSFEDINLLVIDTEGFDFEIISHINFEKIKPDIILYEHKHLKSNDYQMCNYKLIENGYEIINNKFDSLAIKSCKMNELFTQRDINVDQNYFNTKIGVKRGARLLMNMIFQRIMK